MSRLKTNPVHPPDALSPIGRHLSSLQAPGTKGTPDPEAQEEAATQEETTQPEELTEMDFFIF